MFCSVCYAILFQYKVYFSRSQYSSQVFGKIVCLSTQIMKLKFNMVKISIKWFAKAEKINVCLEFRLMVRAQRGNDSC